MPDLAHDRAGEIGRRVFEEWKHQMQARGWAPHQFLPGARYKTTCIEHVMVAPRPGAPEIEKPCVYTQAMHHPDIRPWEELSEEMRADFIDLARIGYAAGVEDAELLVTDGRPKIEA